MKIMIEACNAAVEHQIKAYGSQSKTTKIRRIRETDELFVFDFFSDSDSVLCGGGGLIVYKKDFSVIGYCLPSYPENIFEIMDNAVDVEIPKEYL